jgi:heme-degrading monooxygenase HmoA
MSENEWLADTPAPPYTAVIFTSRRNEVDDTGYAVMATEMNTLAGQQPGFLGIESARGVDRVGITVSYWVDAEAARSWKQVAAHLGAQRLGRDKWYVDYQTRIATVERSYDMDTSTLA